VRCSATKLVVPLRRHFVVVAETDKKGGESGADTARSPWTVVALRLALPRLARLPKRIVPSAKRTPGRATPPSHRTEG